jgi:hypothetical protein
MNVHTIDISVEEWKFKVKTSDMEWLMLQYRGLQHLTETLDNEIDVKTKFLELTHESDYNEMYREVIYPLEDQLMNVDVQLVDVEEEIESRATGLK